MTAEANSQGYIRARVSWVSCVSSMAEFWLFSGYAPLALAEDTVSWVSCVVYRCSAVSL